MMDNQTKKRINRLMSKASSGGFSLPVIGKPKVAERVKPAPPGRKRCASISAAALELRCPFCGEPQPSPDIGSHLWYPSQVVSADGKSFVCECGKSFVVRSMKRVVVGIE